MIQIENIRSLTDFQRNTKEHLTRLKKSGQPEVLTINGQAELVVQDALSYQKLLDDLDRAQAVAGIREGLDSMKRGEGIPLEDFKKKMRSKHGLARAK